MSDLRLSPSQAKILEFLLANLLLAVRFSETSDIQTKNFFAVYREKGTGKTAIVQKLATALERADVRASRATMSASADEQSIYSVLVNKEFRRVFDPRSPGWITDNQSGPCPSGSGLGDIDVLLIDNVSTVPAHSTSIG
jgi:hypothetical protein